MNGSHFKCCHLVQATLYFAQWDSARQTQSIETCQVHKHLLNLQTRSPLHACPTDLRYRVATQTNPAFGFSESFSISLLAIGWSAFSKTRTLISCLVDISPVHFSSHIDQVSYVLCPFFHTSLFSCSTLPLLSFTYTCFKACLFLTHFSPSKNIFFYIFSVV